MATTPFTQAFLKVSGPDAFKFLQGQLTCDLTALQDDQTQLGAHCTPQGRVISFFRITKKNDSYLLQMHKEMIPIAAAALKKYAVFFKVELQTDHNTDVPETNAFTQWEQGIPTIYPDTSGKFLPHEINLPQLSAVSFTKGCFTGQEIIARMEYRAQIKKALFRARTSKEHSVTLNADIYFEKNPAGTIVDFCYDTNFLNLLIIKNVNQPIVYLDDDNAFPLEIL